MMNATLTLTSDDLDDDDIQALTRDLANTINRESDEVSASLPEGPARAGMRGDPVTVGTIILTLIGAGGVAVKLVEVLKSYVERPNHLKVTVKNGRGESVEIDGSNLSRQQLDGVIKILNG